MLLNSSTIAVMALILSESTWSFNCSSWAGFSSLFSLASSGSFVSASFLSAAPSSFFSAFSLGLAASAGAASSAFFSSPFLPSSFLLSASFCAYSASSCIFFCFSICFSIFWSWSSRIFLNLGLISLKLFSILCSVSFSSKIRSLLASSYLVRWSRYSYFFCCRISSIWVKMGLYFCFKVSWYMVSYC